MNNTSNHQPSNNNHSLNNLNTSSLLNGSAGNVGLTLNNNHSNINGLTNQRHRTDLTSSLGASTQLPAHSHSTTLLDTSINDIKSRQQSQYNLLQFILIFGILILRSLLRGALGTFKIMTPIKFSSLGDLIKKSIVSASIKVLHEKIAMAAKWIYSSKPKSPPSFPTSK